MTEVTLEVLGAELRAGLAELKAELAPMRAGLAEVKAELATIRAQLDGLPLINRSITVMQQDLRSLRAAFNDFARTNVTAGEIEALHADVNRLQAENAELSTRLATLERLIRGMGIRARPSHVDPRFPSSSSVTQSGSI